MSSTAFPDLGGSRGLAGFHAARADLYAAAAELLIGTPATGRVAPLRARIEAAVGRLGGSDEWLAMARCLCDPAKRAGLAAAVQSSSCGAANDDRRAEALREAQLPAGGSAADEARAMSVLARRLSTALARGDLVEAARLDALQRAFLREHAAACLEAVAHRLEGTAYDAPIALGRCLYRLIHIDAELLSESRP